MIEGWLASLVPLLGEIGLLLAGIVLVSIASYARKYLKEKVGSEKMELILKKAEMLVKWVEQTMEKLPDFAKKEMVMVALREFAEAIGVLLSDVELDQIIEAQVYQMNADKWPVA